MYYTNHIVISFVQQNANKNTKKMNILKNGKTVK